MKKLSLPLLVLLIALFGAFAFGAHHAAADFTLCDVMADPTNPRSGTDANCLAGQDERALNGVNTKTEFEAYLKSDGKNSQGSQRGGYGFQKIGAKYIANGLGGSDWETRLENPNVSLKIGSYSRCVNTAYDTAKNKVVKYSDCGSSARSLIFYNNKSGKIYYAIKIDCGNPLGDLPGLPDYNKPVNHAPTGNLTPQCTLNASNQTVYSFTYTFSDADGTASAKVAAFLSSGAYPAYDTGHSLDSTTSSAPYRSGRGSFSRVGAWPGGSGHDVWLRVADIQPDGSHTWTNQDHVAPPSCPRVPTPPRAACGSVTTSPTLIEPGSDFTATAIVKFSSTATANAAYAAGTRVYVTVSGPRNYAQTTGGAVSGSTLKYTTPTLSAPPAGSYTINYGLTGGGATLANCPGSFNVAYHPYVSVLGGDSTAGATFDETDGTACTPLTAAAASKAVIKSWNTNGDPTGTYNGAGDQTGAYALGQINSFVTGQGNSTGLSTSRLSFANTTGVATGLYGGNFGTIACIPNYVAQVTNTGDDLSTIDYAKTGYYTYTATGNAHLSGGTLGLGSHITVNVTGNLYIDGDVLYALAGNVDSLARLNVYVTGNIYVRGDVSELHGLFVAQPKADGSGGTFATCYYTPPGGSETETTLYSQCAGRAGGSTLKIYGSVAAAHLDFDRSFGSVSDGQPAEQIIYTPEMWLSGSGTSGFSSGTVESFDAITGLPPTL